MATSRPTVVRTVIAAAVLVCLLVVVVTVSRATWTSTAPTPSPSPSVSATDTTPQNDVEVRVRNASSVEFDKVDVIFSRDPTVDYGALAPGATSAYRVPPVRAYPIALVHVTVDGRKLIYSPVDYVGEALLAPGHYTYVLNVTAGDRLELTFQVDP